jgi:hypothetical protein
MPQVWRLVASSCLYKATGLLRPFTIQQPQHQQSLFYYSRLHSLPLILTLLPPAGLFDNPRASLTFITVVLYTLYPYYFNLRYQTTSKDIMFSKAFLITMAIAYVEARFGQENLPSQAIGAVQGGNPGAAATVAGATISDLLGGANSCAKLQRADQIVADLGGGADAIAAAQGLVAAEKNTNPFAGGNAQNVCGDPSLPATAELRGITPLIDPAVDVNGAAAALSKQSLSAPLNADGMSVFDLMSANGLGDLVVSQAAAGGAAAGGNAGGNAGGIDTVWYNPDHKENTSQAVPTYVVADYQELLDILK